MAATTGQTSNPLIDRLAKEPFAFDFFRAVRMLENCRPDLPRIGCSRSAAEDPLRFWQNPSLAFAPSTLESFQTDGPRSAPRLSIRFFGLFGPNAPLPPHLTEYAYERLVNFADPTITAFFNVFHHRLASFFYRAWAINQKAADLDRPEQQRYADFIGSFLGIGMDTLRHRDRVPDPAKLFFSGRLACQTRNAEGLEAMLQHFFKIRTEVQTFVGRWFSLPPDSVCRLGESAQTGCLGQTALLGSRFWDCQLGFRVCLGPMTLADYERMLPDGPSFARLKAWILNYCGEHFIWDVQLVLRAEEVPTACLGSGSRLGWTTWLKTRTPARDADDLILNPPD